MTARSPIEVKCPTCCATVVWSETSSWKPFCSERCRLLDLGAWFTEERAIPDTADQ
ncbi:MAG: DNA gyrase inhibitor YacG, partial [Gammaproteobacteria bacterium]